MMLEAAVPLNDVHLELEDADHDVIHVVSSPLSFKVVMKNVEDELCKAAELEEGR